MTDHTATASSTAPGWSATGDERARWSTATSIEVTAWCEELVRTTQAPGVIGVTTPQAANTVRDTLGGHPSSAPWTPARIEAWRDSAIPTVRQVLFDPDPDRAFTPRDAAVVGLGLCDIRVRDVIVLDMITDRAAQRTQAGQRMWPIVETLPDILRAPAGSVLAAIEYAAGREVADLLDWVTQATPDYRLAALLTAVSANGVPPQKWLDALSSLSTEECRVGVPALPDPLAAGVHPEATHTSADLRR